MLKLELSARGLLLLAAAALGLWALVELWRVWLLLITALIFMAALLPYAEWLTRHGFSRAWASLVLLFLILAAFAAILVLVVPAMMDEFQTLRTNLPQDARDLEEQLDRFGVEVELDERVQDIDWQGLVSGRAAITYGQQAVLVIVSIITIIALTIYLIIDAPKLAAFMFQFIPPGREPDMDRILTSMGRVVGGYVRGQIITSAVITAYTFIVCIALGVPNAIAFAVLAGFADIVPLVGAAVAIGPPTVAALHESPTKAVIMITLLMIYQQFEDRILVPRVYSRTLNLPPIIVLIAVLIGAELLGVAGVLLALPGAAAARVFIDYWLERRKARIQGSEPNENLFAPE